MKLKDLLTKITVQGDIRISIWDEMGEYEVEVREFYGEGGLTPSAVSDWKNKLVTYIFVGQDNMLHIELNN